MLLFFSLLTISPCKHRGRVLKFSKTQREGYKKLVLSDQQPNYEAVESTVIYKKNTDQLLVTFLVDKIFAIN